MTLQLERLIPLPLLEQDTRSSQLWGQDGIRFEPGKLYLIQAPSGKGKTSLLSILYGLRKDYQGKLLIEGRDSGDLTPREWSALRKSKMSYVFQGLELFDELSGLENILLKNRISHFRTEKEIRDLALRLDLENHLEKKAGILSFGQQQRVAIIRALCQPFRWLLADESFSHLDDQLSENAQGLLQEECRKQEASLILTSLNGPENSSSMQRILL